MNEGEVVQVGTPFEIYESPAHPFVAHFIGETNYLAGTVAEVFRDKHAKVDFPDIGTLIVYQDKPLAVGDKVKVTIRPEKIRISLDKPAALAENMNLLTGRVNELIYSGFQSKFFVCVNGKTQLRVFRQHVKFYMDEKAINWKDEVYIWWNDNDGYVVEVGE
jgi:spermidine/putrescine transport system ATP-binding protein